MNIILDKYQLIKDAEEYFNVLKLKFLYTRKIENVPSLTDRVLRFIFFGILLGALITTFILSERSNFIKTNEYYIWIEQYINAHIDNLPHLGIGTFFALIYIPLFIDFFIERRRSPKFLDDSYYNFCLVFDAFRNLNQFSKNNRKEHLEIALGSIGDYSKYHGDINFQLKKLKNEFNWFVVPNETIAIASAHDKLLDLIKHLTSTGKTKVALQLIELLAIYEYCKIITEIDLPQKLELEEFSLLSLSEFAEKVNNEWIQNNLYKDEDEYRTVGERFKNFVSIIDSGLISPKMSTRIFWWWLVFQIAILILTVIVSFTLKLKPEGEMLALIVGAPIAAAITMGKGTPKH